MDRGSRHRTITIRTGSADYSLHVRPSNVSEEYYTIRFRPSLARRVVHFLLRVTAPVDRPEWGEPRAVADQRGRAPVGAPGTTDTFVAVQRQGRLPNLGGRS